MSYSVFNAWFSFNASTRSFVASTISLRALFKRIFDVFSRSSLEGLGGGGGGGGGLGGGGQKLVGVLGTGSGTGSGA
ncbi:ORF1345 [White spot syndrome virus]|uniref:ORF1345 n=1 Tax=White spot syndrome virus TaxID=342409 RepID=A0A2D3I691_9VIRU|nr:ORF1345 [White spot syndrome virus]